MKRSLSALVGLPLICALAACTAADEGPTTAEGEEDLTSLSARQRVLQFEGIVYVEPNQSDTKILEVVHKQTQSAFGALLAQEIGVNSREVQNVDPRSFKKRNVTVVDPAGATSEMVEVRYSYKDNAVVPVAMSRKTSLQLALLGQGHEAKMKEVVENCTKNDKEAREDADGGLLWYDFNPSKASCRQKMSAEQRIIDAETAALADSKKMVPKSRTERVYLPVTFALSRSENNAVKSTYPEYDRLFSGGAEPGVLNIVLLAGRLAHDRVEAKKDDGYYHWMDALGVVFDENPDFELKKIEPSANLPSGVTFKDAIKWVVYDQWPSGVNGTERTALATTFANTVDNHWLTFEKKVKVSIGNAAPKDLTIRIETLFGADEDPKPHQRALSRGDVVIYNGHSYIGYGPLDPDNFKSTRFPGSYQLFWFDSCVSYNYYEKDFFTLKEGGSKNLDLITNGLEAPEWESGAAEGKFITKFLSGQNPSYQVLLEAAKATDSLRVVDGEIDNRFHPDRTSVKLSRP